MAARFIADRPVIGPRRRWQSVARAGAPSQAAAVAVACLMLLAGGCAARRATELGGAGHQSAASGTVPGSGVGDLARDYLAIAEPANRRLDREVHAYNDHAQSGLAAAESALRAEAATERRFDELLLRIKFPLRIEATAQALVAVNQRRIALTERQAQSASTAGLLALTGSRKSADAAVEAEVRIMRRLLGLPPPENS